MEIYSLVVRERQQTTDSTPCIARRAEWVKRFLSVKPMAWALCRLMSRPKHTGCSTGRVAGRAQEYR
jgi:hypothetical protein